MEKLFLHLKIKKQRYMLFYKQHFYKQHQTNDWIRNNDNIKYQKE